MKLVLMKQLFPVAAAVLTALSAGAQAQNAVPNPANNQPVTNAAGVLRAPDGVTNVISVDAQNILIVETQDDKQPDAPKQYSLIKVRHIYSGSLARLFGGTVLPSELFVSPATAGRSGFSTPGTLTPMTNNNPFGNNPIVNNSNNNNPFGNPNPVLQNPIGFTQ